MQDGSVLVQDENLGATHKLDKIVIAPRSIAFSAVSNPAPSGKACELVAQLHWFPDKVFPIAFALTV